ncbi:SDR family oxidoreductase, partial [Candidatus Woesearchaeota archaeon]|nr:SDR family oxidoreductase [Candidatus Woesearchaeota archaeon]
TRLDGYIDILVNNAGIYLPENQNKQDLEIYNKIHSINGWGVYNCCKQAEKFMAVNSIIINISSIYAIKPNPDSILASGVKAEVENYTKSFALKYKEKIRVNSIAPGYTNTKLVINNFSDKELNKIINETPQKRLLTPKEIAYSVLYLIKARGITGQSLVLDGGYLL